MHYRIVKESCIVCMQKYKSQEYYLILRVTVLG
uniref:Uncharacterized protein n=1 Tax=Setaria italica TaxID=4555 RepID=K3Z1A1_SETIT